MPLQLFFSYSHKDQRLRDELAAHLKVLERTGLVDQWYDGCIEPGSQWNDAIMRNLEQADIILLLVSADFITSDFCWGEELQRALARAEMGNARVIPVVLRPTFWTGTPLAVLEALPKDREQLKPVTRWTDRDSAWVVVVSAVNAVAQQLAARVSSPALPKKRAAPRVTSEVAGPVAGTLRRAVHAAGNKDVLPGKLMRREGQAATGDPAVDEAYDALGAAHAFFWQVFQRDSIDGRGMPLVASVHYSRNYANAFWNGKEMVFGDGDGEIFARFTIAPDIVAKQFANAVVARDARLDYWGQSGALFNSLASVFAVLTRQYQLGQTADQADWLLGNGLLLGATRGMALISLAAPGSAYDHPELGRDPQPAHMRDLVESEDDSGGVHLNSGIPNKAFFLAASDIGGFAWDKAGRIWYAAMRDPRLQANASFSVFARLTATIAAELFGGGASEVEAVRRAWAAVGVKLAGAKPRGGS